MKRVQSACVSRDNTVSIRTALMNMYAAEIYESEIRNLKEKVTDVCLAKKK
jgi:hypothetical protein